MKAENLPIKVQCFRVRDKGLEDIGYVLIPLRNIPTCLYKNDEIAPSPRWFKIMGVSGDLLHNKPELHLHVIIQPEQESTFDTHLRGKFDLDEEEEDDESFAEPPLEHFELQMDVIAEEVDGEEEAKAKKKLSNSVEEGTKPSADSEEEKKKYVQSLEEWRDEEKENFKSHLKKVENSFLESMFEEWQRKKHEEDNQLKLSLEECGRLSKKLEEGYAQMKEFQRKEKENEALQEREGHLKDQLGEQQRKISALETDLQKERQDNEWLRHKLQEMELNNATAEHEIADQIVSI